MATWTTGFVAYLQPGVSVTLAFTWPTGQDPGVQAVIARPKGPGPQLPPASPLPYEVTTESYGVAARLKDAIPSYPIDPGSHYGWKDYSQVPLAYYETEWTYFATFRNTGQRGALCELIGGKVV